MKLKFTSVNLLLLLFIPIALVDTVNGFFSLSGNSIPLSILYKSVIVGVTLFITLANPLVSMLIVYVIFVSLYQSANYTQSFIYDFSSLLKSFLLPLMLLVFFHYKNKLDRESSRIIEWIFVATFICISFNVLLGIINIGFTTYGSYPISSGFGHGFKGFIYAGNELGGLLVVTYPIVITYIQREFRKFRFYVNILYAIVAVLIGTKTAMVGIMILIIYNNFSFAKYWFSKIILPALFLVFVIYFFTINSEHFQVYIDRFTFFYESKGLMYFLLSGRDVFLNEALDYFDSRYSFSDYLFGIGASYSNVMFKSTEMDFFDLMIWHGLIWSIVVYISYILLFLFAFKEKRSKGFVLMLMLLAIISTFAGHVLTSAMITPLLSLYYPYILVRKNEENSTCQQYVSQS